MGLFDKKYANTDEIVKVLMPNLGAGRKLTKDQLKPACKMFVENSSRIIRDNIKLVNESTAPGVFFERLDTLIEWLYKSVIVESVFPIFNPPLRKQYDKVVANKETTINDFIDRYIQKVLEKANALNTQVSKEKALLNGKANLEVYKSKMPAPCYIYFKSKVESWEA